MEDAAIRGSSLVDRMAAQLRHAGLRPTRQRVELGRVLFARGHRHISAEDLHAEAEAAGVRVSLATVYNALHQFTEAGLLREVAIDGTRTYFDTNVSDHHHFFVEGEGRLIDMERRRRPRPIFPSRRPEPRSLPSKSWCASAAALAA